MFWRRNRSRNRRKEAGKRALRLPAIPWRRLLPAGAVVAGAAALLFCVRFAMDQPVKRLDVSGRWQRVQLVDVQAAVRKALGGQGMVGVDLQAISRAVRQIPWVDQANVARSWPSGLHVEVIEQVPVARWGEAGLLNARGELFIRDSSSLPAELPEFAGPDASQAQMTEVYLSVQPRLDGVGMRLSRLRLDERGAWEIELDNGVQLRLGRQQLDDGPGRKQFEERFDRFITTASRVVTQQAGRVQYVDLRYANGFAIGWRAGAGEVNRG